MKKLRLIFHLLFARNYLVVTDSRLSYAMPADLLSHTIAEVEEVMLEQLMNLPVQEAPSLEELLDEDAMNAVDWARDFLNTRNG